MKPCILTGLTRNGCFQKEVSGFLEALHYIRKRWDKKQYLVNSRLYGVKDKFIDMDEYILPQHCVVVIEKFNYSDELPF